jgi:hypothetical protein
MVAMMEDMEVLRSLAEVSAVQFSKVVTVLARVEVNKEAVEAVEAVGIMEEVADWETTEEVISIKYIFTHYFQHDVLSFCLNFKRWRIKLFHKFDGYPYSRCADIKWPGSYNGWIYSGCTNPDSNYSPN